jgi:Amt family ammonium transporter
VLVVLSVLLFDRLKLDDPVGALSVHLVCGIWGTLAVGLLGAKAGGTQLMAQVTGIAAVGAFTFVFAFALFTLIKATIGLRVSAAEELEGLDLGEHGYAAYPDFQGLGTIGAPVTTELHPAPPVSPILGAKAAPARS